MAMRGIDAQVMLHRTAEYVKDANAMLRRNDITHDVQAHLNNVETALKQEQVLSLQQKEAARIRLEERKRQEAQKKKKKKKPLLGEPTDLVVDGFEPDDPTVGTAVPYKLDIEV